jgi:hypothetical protein
MCIVNQNRSFGGDHRTLATWASRSAALIAAHATTSAAIRISILWICECFTIERHIKIAVDRIPEFPEGVIAIAIQAGDIALELIAVLWAI